MVITIILKKNGLLKLYLPLKKSRVGEFQDRQDKLENKC